MKSLTTLQNLYTTLSQNTTSTNIALGKQLMNDLHRLLLQKYFDNEKTFIITTVGGQSLTLTGAPALSAISGTLTATWSLQSCTQFVLFSTGEMRYVQFTYNSTAITWQGPLTSGSNTTAITTKGIADYNIPAHVSKIKNGTITVGQLKYQPTFIETRAEWDAITMLPYTSDIPNYCFIYDGKLSIFPIPSTTGNVITFNHKVKVPDLTFADYSTGTIASSGVVKNLYTVTGSSTSWNTTGTYPLSTDISFYNLFFRVDPPYGDGIWYPISQFTSDTVLTLGKPIINAPNITSSSTYTIGQMPLLQEDFHDMLVYGALRIYYTTFVKDNDKFKMYESLYKERLDLLTDYAGSKQVNVDLGGDIQPVNPNLFLYSNS